jgi:hypothetical protein
MTKIVHYTFIPLYHMCKNIIMAFEFKFFKGFPVTIVETLGLVVDL